MPVDFLQGWMKDRIEGSLTEGRRGEYKPGFWESVGGGMVGVDAGKVADDVKTYDDNQDALEVLKSTGKSRTQLNLPKGDLTPEQVRGAYANFTETKAETDRTQGITDKLRILQTTQAPQLAGIQAGLTKAEQQTQLLLQQGKDAHTLQLQELAANRDSQAAQLEYEKMRDRRADQEYNERMERLDRKDRQAMMQNLAAGLASLGAAFAL